MTKRFYHVWLASFLLILGVHTGIISSAAHASEQIKEITLPKSPPLPETAPARDKQGPDSPSVPRNGEQRERVYQVACPALINGDAEGEILPPINDGNECRVKSPLKLTAIGKEGKLAFKQPVTVNCSMAVSLAQWSEAVRKAAEKSYGASKRIATIGTGSDYQCRNVNNATEARVSEHAFANALDIMSFTFTDGTVTHLETGWDGSEAEKRFWRAVHKASCSIFMTVTGPDGDEAHKTNMHLDQGCHGTACLATICQ